MLQTNFQAYLLFNLYNLLDMETNEFRSLDSDRVNINEYYEVEYWSKQFDLRPEVFKALIKEAGTDSIKALRAYLDKNYRGNAA